MYSELKIIIFGDSTGVGVGSTVYGGYRSVLLARIRAHIGFNPTVCGWSQQGNFGDNRCCATSGDRNDELLVDARLQIPAYKADVGICMIGLNDCTQRNSGAWLGTVQDSTDSLEEMLDLFFEVNPRGKFFLLNLIPNGLAGANDQVILQNASYAAMLATKAYYLDGRLEYLDANAKFLAQPSWLSTWMTDNTHPNKTGYEDGMADLIADAFEAWWRSTA